MSPQSDLERLIEPAVLDGIDQWPVEDVQQLRDACRASEVRISYERRVAQGRLDIARAEQARRSSGSSGAGGRTPEDLVAELSTILADRPSGAPRSDRAVGLIDPDDDDLTDMPGILSVLDLSDEDLAALITTLEGTERQLSVQRRKLLDNLDRLQEELVIRYRDGRAHVGGIRDNDSETPG